MSKGVQSRRSKRIESRDEVYVRISVVVSETRLSFEETLKSTEHDCFFVYMTPSSNLSLAPTGWISLTEEAHGFLLYRCKKLHDDSKFKMTFVLDESVTFKISDINIQESIYQMLKAMALSSKELHPPESAKANRGAHWQTRRIEILAAALQVVSESSSNEKAKIWVGNGRDKRINATKLAEEIHDNRHRWETLKKEMPGTSLRNIIETLQKALKTTD